MYTQTTQNDTT